MIPVCKIPNDDLPYLFFQNQIQPDTRCPSIPLPERVGNIHLNIFLNNFIKAVLGHGVDVFQRMFQIHHWGKTEMIFGDIHFSQPAGKIIDITKEVCVNESQSGKGAHDYVIEVSCIKEQPGFLFTDFFLSSRQFNLTGYV